MLGCQANGDIRLVNGIPLETDKLSGRVEVFINSHWNRIIPTTYNGIGKAVCRQLDYTDVLVLPIAIKSNTKNVITIIVMIKFFREVQFTVPYYVSLHYKPSAIYTLLIC